MSHTTKLRNGWIAIHDGTLYDKSKIVFKKIEHEDETLPAFPFSVEYHVIRDFFADQIGYDLHGLFDDVDAAGLIDRLIEKNRKPKIKNFWEQTHLGKTYEAVGLGENRRDPFPIKATVHFTNEAQYNEFMKWVGDEKKHFVVIEKDV